MLGAIRVILGVHKFYLDFRRFFIDIVTHIRVRMCDSGPKMMSQYHKRESRAVMELKPFQTFFRLIPPFQNNVSPSKYQKISQKK